MNDEILIEAIKESGFYEYKDVNLDDLTNLQRSAIILAQQVQLFRPDLFIEKDHDVVFVIQRTFENGDVGCSLPKNNLNELLKTAPYDDSVIYSYSLKNEKLLKKLYKGTGKNWELIK